jgi:ABC-2 type transport system permease protein
MNRNLFMMELKRNAPALIIWSLIICLLITATMMIYPTFLANQSKIMGMLSIVPKGALQFKGITNFDDLLSVLGFYAGNNLIFMMVLGSIFAIVLSSGILLREEYNRTAEYLLTRPVTRSEVFFSKGALIFLWILILNIITTLAGFISIEIVRTAPYNVKAFFMLSFSTFLLNLLFGTVGLFISVLVKRARPVTSFSIGLVLVCYFIYTISKISQEVFFLGYLSPFRYVGVDVLSSSYRLDPWNLAYFLGLTLLLGISSLRIYRRKDIYL